MAISSTIYNLNDNYYNPNQEHESSSVSSNQNTSEIDDAQLSKNYHKILDFSKKHQARIINSRNANQTVRGIGLLNKHAHIFKRPTLTNQVYKLTGLAIHAADNYPNVETFKSTVKDLETRLLSGFEDAPSDVEKLHLFNYGLRARGCFEARAEELMDYLKDTQSLYGLLKHEIRDFNLANKKSEFNPVRLEDLIDYLTETHFFERYHIDKGVFMSDPLFEKSQTTSGTTSSSSSAPVSDKEETTGAPLADSVLEKLQTAGLLILKEQSALEKVNEAAGLYTDFGMGLAHFRTYLLENAHLDPLDEANIDQLISDYFKEYPDRAKWI